MVYWANWLDSASHTPEYAYTATWHYANVDEGFTYETMTKNPDGDIVETIDRIVAELKDGQLDPAQEQLYLKMLIHLVGDLHQPMHTGRQLRSRTILRPGEQSPCSLGQLPARSGPQVELYGVAKPARPPHRRGGGPNPIRHTARLVQGEQCDLPGDIRCDIRRQRSFLRLYRYVCPGNRAAVAAWRTPPGRSAERDIRITETSTEKSRSSPPRTPGFFCFQTDYNPYRNSITSTASG